MIQKTLSSSIFDFATRIAFGDAAMPLQARVPRSL